MTIFKGYKDFAKDLIDSLDIESLIVLRSVGNWPYNIMANVDNSLTKPKLDNLTKLKLDKDLLDELLQQ